jgi:hypothetical protein
MPTPHVLGLRPARVAAESGRRSRSRRAYERSRALTWEVLARAGRALKGRITWLYKLRLSVSK